MNRKRVFTLALCAIMAMGSSMTALASTSTANTDSGSGGGTGVNEGLAVTDIYSVTLPTVTANTYDFYLDPDNNIEDTTASRYSGFTPTNTTNAYFKTDTSTMTAKSASASLINESYVDIDVTMKVVISGATNIVVEDISANDPVAVSKSAPTMYMALETKNTSAKNPTGVSDTSYVPAGLTLTKTFTVASDKADYTKVWSSSNSDYEMSHTGTASAPGQLDFDLLVGCNTTDDCTWSATAAAEAPTVSVTYSYAKHASVNLTATDTFTATADGSKVYYTDATVTTITSITVYDKDDESIVGTIPASSATINDQKIIIPVSALTAVATDPKEYSVVVVTDQGTDNLDYANLTTTVTASAKSDGSSVYYADATSASISSVTVFSGYSKIGTVATSATSISSSKVLITTAGLNAVATTSGTYYVVVVTDAATDVFTYTVQ